MVKVKKIMTKEMQKKIETGTEKKRDILKNQTKHNYVYLSLGSNLKSKYGSRINNLKIAQLLLISKSIKIINVSSYYETLAFPNKKDPKFINCVIKIQTELSALDLLKITTKIEKFIGRSRKIKNEPRVCDIDIIDYKGKTINIKKPYNLIIPHKELHKRSFVLIPLIEIEHSWIHPVFFEKISSLLDKLPISDRKYIKKVIN